MRSRNVPVVFAVALLAACQGDGPTVGVRPGAGAYASLATQPGAERWIVTLQDDDPSPAATASRLAGAFGAVPTHVYEYAIKGFAVALSPQAAAALARMPSVRRVEPDLEMTIVGTQTSATWGLDRLDQRALPLSTTYTYNNDAAGVTSYILDTGVRYDHSEFYYSATDTRSRASFGYDAMGDGGNGADCHGHGTHVAGTVGGRMYGVAKQASLVSVRVLGCTGSGSTSGIIGALDWMVNTHTAGVPAVGNMSLGGGFSQSLNDAVERAVADGIVMALAAGNSNADACGYSPASAPNAITLGATGSNDDRASFSNWGNCVDFFAPGVSITSASYSSTTGTAVFSGTSMASPHAAGAAALYLAAYPGSTPAAVRDGLFNMATPGIVTSASSANNHLLYTLGIPGAGSPPPNVPPTAAFTPACNGLTCTFTDQSTDSDGTIASRAWTFGDGATSTDQNPSHTFAAAGTYTVQLVATDDDGATGSASRGVTVTTATTSIVLSGTKRIKGTFKVDLTWTGSSAASMDVYRNGARVATVANSGAHTDNLGKKVGTYTHQVCEAGTSICSNTTSTTF